MYLCGSDCSVYHITTFNKMETKPNKYITVAYKLYAVEDGEQDFVEEAPVEHPFQFISGLGTSLVAFEDAIINLNPGDKFELNIPAEDAYGEYYEEYVIDLPKSIFTFEGHFDHEMVQEGKVVPLMDSDGRRLNGTVVEVLSDIVIVDMNHPLAGADLLFTGEVVESRKATPEEIQGMISMMANEGCDCGSCGDGDCDCDHDHHGCSGCH